VQVAALTLSRPPIRIERQINALNVHPGQRNPTISNQKVQNVGSLDKPGAALDVASRDGSALETRAHGTDAHPMATNGGSAWLPSSLASPRIHAATSEFSRARPYFTCPCGQLHTAIGNLCCLVAILMASRPQPRSPQSEGHQTLRM